MSNVCVQCILAGHLTHTITVFLISANYLTHAITVFDFCELFDVTVTVFKFCELFNLCGSRISGGDVLHFSHNSESTVPPVSEKWPFREWRAHDEWTCSCQTLQEGSENVWQTRTSAPHPDLQKPSDSPQQRWRDPAFRPREASYCQWRDAPATGLRSFPMDSAAAHVSFTTSNAGACEQNNLTQHIFSCTFTHVFTPYCGSRCRSECLIRRCSSTCHHVSERLLFPCFGLLPLSLVPPRSLSLLPVLCPEQQLPCGRNRRALNPMRTRRMRSIAPWRYTTLSQVMSPISSTTSTTQKLMQ